MMKHSLIVLVSAAFLVTQAQTAELPHNSQMHHDMHGAANEMGEEVAAPREGGQAAFAAIQEIVTLLMADETTDWSRVDIPALQRHLVDMNNVTLRARVDTEPAANGLRFKVSGEDDVRGSIQRMVAAHAKTMTGTYGLTYDTVDTPDGAEMTVHASKEVDLPMLKALGFIGVMTLGAHHQQHHLAIASGNAPHH